MNKLTGEVVDEAPFNVYAGRDTSRFAIMFDGDDAVSRTSQEFAEEADINNIMARYIKTGTIPVFVDRMSIEGDQHSMSFHEMMNVVATANSSFMQLPSAIREFFDNDASKFVDFASDKANAAQLREWGMLSPEAVERLDSEAAAAAAAQQLADQEALEGRLADRLAKRPKGDAPATQ